MKIINDISAAMSEAYDLDSRLQNMIETIVQAMSSSYGSIYLRLEGTDTFVMRAATEPSKHLIGKAAYKVGEGTTGAIAGGELLNFGSKNELYAYPNWSGKYRGEVWEDSRLDDNYTLLGVPIKSGDSVIGLWKIENIRHSQTHPEPYYTEEDIRIARFISGFLEHVIQAYIHEQSRLREFIQLAITSISIQQALDEEGAISAVMIGLEESGFSGALLSLYDANSKLLAEILSSGSTWITSGANTCHIEDNDIRAVVLRMGREELILDSVSDSRCLNNPAGERLKSQYVVPLRLGDELIGTLQIDMGDGPMTDLALLTLKAFASHLAISISRTRSIEQTVELNEQIMRSSRFITAESLSAMAVHSLTHKLVQINNQLQKDLARRDIRENGLLFETLNQWRTNLSELETDLKNVLRFVRAPADAEKASHAELHPEIQTTISMWINYIRHNKCTLRTDLRAKSSSCRLSAETFREILAVLLVNSVQAHARHLAIETYNEENARTSSGSMLQFAFCLVFSDDGVGLSALQPGTIFEPTYTTKANNLGAGLGLFIARRLARNAGGDLEVVNSIPNVKGATFRLILPLMKEH